MFRIETNSKYVQPTHWFCKPYTDLKLRHLGVYLGKVSFFTKEGIYGFLSIFAILTQKQADFSDFEAGRMFRIETNSKYVQPPHSYFQNSAHPPTLLFKQWLSRLDPGVSLTLRINHEQYLEDLVTMTPFWMERSSDGRPSKLQRARNLKYYRRGPSMVQALGPDTVGQVPALTPSSSITKSRKLMILQEGP